MRSETSRHLGAALIVALAYLLVGMLSRNLAHAATQTMPVWLGAGVIFGALLVCARSRWPAIVGASLLAAFVWGMAAHDLAPGAALLFGVIEVASAAAGALVAARATRAPADTDSLSGAAGLVAGAVLTAVAGATLAAEFWHWQRPDSIYGNEWQAWAFSTAVGILLVVPVITNFRSFRIRRSGGMPMAQFLAGGAAFAVFLLVAWIVFGPGIHQRFGPLAATFAYIPMPFLIVTLMLWGPRGGSLATLAGAILIIARTAAGGGPFAVADAFEGEAAIEVQAYIALWAVLILFAGGLAASRRQALAAAQAWRLRYERTLQATGVASVEFDAVTGAATWGPSAAAVLGSEVENIASIADWHARIDDAERALAESCWHAVAQGQRPASSDMYGIRLGGRSLAIQARLAAILGPDQAVEQIAGLIRLVPVDDGGALHSGARPGGAAHG